MEGSGPKFFIHTHMRMYVCVYIYMYAYIDAHLVSMGAERDM